MAAARCLRAAVDVLPGVAAGVAPVPSGSGPTLGGARWGCGAGAGTGPASVRHRWAVEP